jgi:multiple antibiotic resistance protein
MQRRIPLTGQDLMPRSRSVARIMILLAAGSAAAFGAAAAQAAPAADEVRRFAAAQVFTFLFLMLGPFKIIGPFAKVTQGMDTATTRRVALTATVFAALALGVAALLGESILRNYGIPLPVLALSAGLILFLVALSQTLEQFAGPHAQADDSAPTSPATTQPSKKAVIRLALSPLAFPAIVTPYGIAALVVFLAFSATPEARLTVGAILLLIMALNLAVMLVTRRLLPVLSLVLPILGAVLGVVQVALGLQIIHNSLKALGVL